VFLLKEKVFSREAGKIISVMLLLAIVVLSAATYMRNELWADTIRLWEDTAKKSPAIAAVHNNLGNSYLKVNMPEKAIEQYLTAIQLRPGYAEAHNNLGNSYLKVNMPEKAIEQ